MGLCLLQRPRTLSGNHVSRAGQYVAVKIERLHRKNCFSVIDTVQERSRRSTVAGREDLNRNSGSGIVRQRMERSVDESEACGR